MLNWKLLGLVLLTAAFGTVGEKPGFALSLGGRCSPDGSVCVTANNGEEEPVSIIAGLRAKDADARRGAREAAVRLGAPMVEPLFDLLAEDDVACRRVAEGTLFAIVAASSAPDAPPAPRAAVSEALVAQLRGKGPARVRVYAARLLGLIGGAGAVPA
ncbi:MAG TPA: hypothetical protein EYP85_14050, partial [Armatimonadetes bacterium]|nr:hypothetical protein [Armatimonadota bacterium]